MVPFYTVLVQNTGTDISDLISGIRFTESKKKDNVLEVTIKKASVDIIDSDDFKKGNILVYSFGFKQGKSSPKRYAEITNISVQYRNTITLTINSHDKGFYLKKYTSQEIFSGKTSSEIVKEIGISFGFELSVSDTTLVHDCLPVAGKNYMDFIQHLSTLENENGSCIEFFISDNTLHFSERNLSTDSKITYTYGDGSDTIKSFVPKTREKDSSSTETVAFGIDGDTGEIIESNKKSTDIEESCLDRLNANWNIDGKFKDFSQDISGKHLTRPEDKKDQLDKQVLNQVQNSMLGEVTATLSVVLNPEIKLGDIITLNGVAEIHSGNWYVQEIVHVIESGGASSDLQLNKNAVSQNTSDTSENANDPNKSIGGNEYDNSEVIRVDDRGNIQ